MAFNYDNGDLVFLLTQDQIENVLSEQDFKDIAYKGFDLAIILRALAVKSRVYSSDIKLVCAVAALRGPRACYAGSKTNLKLPDAIRTKLVTALRNLGIKDNYRMKTSDLAAGELSAQRVATACPHFCVAALIYAASGKEGMQTKSFIGDVQYIKAAKGKMPLWLFYPGTAMLLKNDDEWKYYSNWVATTRGVLVNPDNGTASTADPVTLASAAYNNRDKYGPQYVTMAREYLEKYSEKMKAQNPNRAETI
jgi:hypothetical protein